MLNRLVNKGVLGFERYKNLYLYRPRFSEEECVMQQSESFLKRVFDGSVSLMLVQFVRNKKLSPSEIRKLREILKNLEG
jgi:BlaI family penicillinase repressor